MISPYALVLYIDGSYKPKFKKGGFAVAVHYPEAMHRSAEIICSIPYTPTTINQMELEACIRALKFVVDNAQKLNVNHAIICSDSEYVVKWQYKCHEWNKNKWFNHKGAPIKNSSIWRKFMTESRKARAKVSRLEIVKVPGKSSLETVEVDRKAKEVSSSIGGARYPAPQRVRVTRALGSDKRAPVFFPAHGQTIKARIYSDMYVGKYLEVRFQEYYLATKEYSRRYISYIDPKFEHKVHRGHYYTLSFNKNKGFPVILKITTLRIK